MADTYRIVRVFYTARKGAKGPGRRRREVMRRNLTLAEAQAHCADPDTSSRTGSSYEAARTRLAGGMWMDVYERE